MRIIGKVLLLALACVAATEVRGNDSQCQTEEALKQAARMFRQISNMIHATVDTYSNGYLEFYSTCETYWGTVWDYANEELDEVKNASLELTELAKEQESPEEVFACISEKTQVANEVLRVIPWTFDKRLQREADKYYDQHTEIAAIAFDYMETYRDYYWRTIVQGLKECETDECLQLILDNYEEEFREKAMELGQVVGNLDINAEGFKRSAATMLSGVRETLRFARITGVDDIKKCLPVSN